MYGVYFADVRDRRNGNLRWVGCLHCVVSADPELPAGCAWRDQRTIPGRLVMGGIRQPWPVVALVRPFVCSERLFLSRRPGGAVAAMVGQAPGLGRDRRLGEDVNALDAGALRSEEHTSELQSLMRSSYAV